MNQYKVLFIDPLGRDDEAFVEAPNLETVYEAFNAEFGDNCAIEKVVDIYAQLCV